MNIAGVAHSFGLLRLPQMKELKKCNQCLKECFVGRKDIITSSIIFKDQKAEKLRQQKINNKFNKLQGVIGNQKQDELKNVENYEEKKNKRKRKLSDSEELQWEASILKKFKKGKLTKNAVEDLF